MRAIRIAASGGPGRPRNVGIDEARGEFIYFVDDDWLGPEALERMYAMAARNDSDVVLGKMVGHGRDVPKWIFRESRDNAEIFRDRLLTMLTPHKLFRSSFLRQHRIRFPEGPERLEDHRFCVKAYLNARVISVLADYVCCHWVRREGGGYSAARFDPVKYFDALREVLDIVDEHVRPGPERDRFYAHWYRRKMLKRLGGDTFLSYPENYRRELYAEIRRLTVERFTPEVERWLAPHMRVSAALLRADAYDDLVRLAEAERGMTVQPRVDDLGWDGEELVVRVTARLAYRTGDPVVFRTQHLGGRERLLWQLPVHVRTSVSDEARDVTDTLPKSRLQVLLRRRDDGCDFALPTSYTVQADDSGDGTRQLTFTGEVRLDVDTAQFGRPMQSGVWDYMVRVESFSWPAQRRLGALRSPRAEAGCVGGIAGHDHRVVVPYWTQRGNLSVETDASSLAQMIAAAAPTSQLRHSRRTVQLAVPLPQVPTGSARLHLTRPAHQGTLQAEAIDVPAQFSPAAAGAVPYAPVGAGGTPGRMVAEIPLGTRPGRLGTGTWQMEVRSHGHTARSPMVLGVSRRQASLRWAGRGTGPEVRAKLSRLRRILRDTVRTVPGGRSQ